MRKSENIPGDRRSPAAAGIIDFTYPSVSHSSTPWLPEETLARVGTREGGAQQYIVRVKHSVRKNEKAKGEALFSGHKDFTVKIPTTGLVPVTRREC